MDDLSRSVEFFRRAKDRGGDTKLLARGIFHLMLHLDLLDGLRKPKDLLTKAWKYNGQASLKGIAEALYLITKNLKSDNRRKDSEDEEDDD